MNEKHTELSFPNGTSEAIKWTTIIRQEEPLPLSERASSRMVKIAANLPKDEWVGWQMAIPTDGSVGFSSFGSKTVRKSDLEWVVEESADTIALNKKDIKNESAQELSSWHLYEIALPVAEVQEPKHIGFSSNETLKPMAPSQDFQLNYYRWPQNFGDQF